MLCRSTNQGAVTANKNGGIKMKARLYYRLFRDEDAEMNSLQNQRQILVDYADQNGYDITGESFDDNVSPMTSMPRISARRSAREFVRSRKRE